jgi:uncharacterized protein (TIRG00374 family)
MVPKNQLFDSIVEKFNKSKFILISKLDSLFNYKKYIFLYLIVIAIFFFLFHKFGFFTIFKYKINVFYLLLFLVLTVFQLFFLSLRFWISTNNPYSLKHPVYYLAGFATTLGIPPKPLGEAMRILVFKYYYRFSYSRVMLSVLFENFFDIIFVLIIGILSAVLLPFPTIFDRILLTLLYVALGLIFVFSSYYFIKHFNLKIKYKFFVFSFLGRLFDLCFEYMKKVKLLTFKTIFFGSFFTVLKILTITFRMYLIFLMFGYEINFFVVLGLWALCEIIGTASMLPGGLGVYELSFIYLSGVLGINEVLSFGVILIERLFSFWIFIAVGFGILIFSKKPLAQMKKEFFKYVEKQMSALFIVYTKTELKTKEFAEKIKGDIKEKRIRIKDKLEKKKIR